ncbi:MAG: hypothetical protein O9295_03015 [Microcystis sp. LE18-22.4A]|nr:hypothetical protein [Microcystis sp. LE18-22.4A]
MINSQVMNCFSPHPTPHYPILFKQDLVSPKGGSRLFAFPYLAKF